MRAWQRNAVVTAITIFVPLLSEHALAQNLLTNPHFDASLDGWSYFPLPPPPPGTPLVSWTNTFDHAGEGTGAGGSIRLATSFTTPESFAVQCLPINTAETYAASAWVYSTCVGSRLYVFWATQDDCKDTGDFDAVNVRTSKANVWEQVSLSAIPATTPKAATKAVVTLVNPGCNDGAYFDDVFFGAEEIFGDNFEGKALR